MLSYHQILGCDIFIFVSYSNSNYFKLKYWSFPELAGGIDFLQYIKYVLLNILNILNKFYLKAVHNNRRSFLNSVSDKSYAKNKYHRK